MPGLFFYVHSWNLSKAVVLQFPFLLLAEEDYSYVSDLLDNA